MTRKVRGFPDVRCWCVLLVALGLGLAHAADPGPQALYRQGSFESAYRQAVTVDSGDMQTIAAKAAIARGLYQSSSDSDALTWLRHAQDAAEKAVKLASDSPAALLALAQAKGEIAQRTGPLSTVSVPGDVGDLLKRALKLAPNDPEALVAMGMWNLELTNRGVGWMFGAKRSGSLEMVAKGVSLAPDRVDLRVQYASALKIEGDDGKARQQLQQALAMSPATAVERYEQKRASTMLQQLSQGSG